MTENSKYSEKDWGTISIIPQLTGMLMSTAIYSGVAETKIELQATIDAISIAEKKFPDNELILSIIPKGATHEETQINLKRQQEGLIKKTVINTKEDLEMFQKKVFLAYTTALYSINLVEVGFVVNEFKAWILNIAEEVAVSAIEGNFLTVNDSPFSEEERVIFNKIKRTLFK